jgi:hypothetical protein
VQLVAPTRISPLSAKKKTKEKNKKKKGKTRQDKSCECFLPPCVGRFSFDELETEENRGTGAFT